MRWATDWHAGSGRGTYGDTPDSHLHEIGDVGRCAPEGHVVADGRLLALDGAPFRVRGVTYGSFAARVDGATFPDRARVKQDLVDMAAAGLNTVRTYDLPPVELFDIAEELGLRVLVGLDYHDWRMEASTGQRATRRILDAGRRAVDEAMSRCAGRACVLAIAVGNEAPGDLVRLHGSRRVADVLSALVAEVHEADPTALSTYVSYPTTEFLEVEGCDLACFNVFLESAEGLRGYVRHLQTASRGLPVVLTELGYAAAIHGETAQANLLREQLRLVDECGCAGATVFAWTDEWAVAGTAVDGWGFGITSASRRRKPALEIVERWALTPAPQALRPQWPRMSVIVCAYNEEHTIAECLASLAASDYPDLEVIVCDDGSTDRTADRARAFAVRLLPLAHGGLSRARNAGLAAATGEIVAFLDADAACHPEWPYHLALALEDEGVVAAGGPNLPFETMELVERAVACSPGAPQEVLLTDDRAEHVPGCNMAYLKPALESIGGFDPVYTAAGDDVDVCWRLLDRGDQIAFAPAAQVRHHRRRTVRAYLKQQRGYGRAEAILADAHPDRFNRFGQAGWSGVIYGGSRVLPRLLSPVVYHGPMGEALFKPILRRPAESVQQLAAGLLPVALPVVVASSVLAWVFPWALLLAATALASVLAYGVATASTAAVPRREPRWLTLRALIGVLHVLQPFARVWGRVLHPVNARRVEPTGTGTPQWRGDRSLWLGHLARELRRSGCAVRPGGPLHGWDLAVSVSVFVRARVTTAVAWRWEPRHRVRYTTRPVLWGSASVAAALALLDLRIGWMLLGVLVVAGSAEVLMLHRKLTRALRLTTRGART